MHVLHMCNHCTVIKMFAFTGPNLKISKPTIGKKETINDLLTVHVLRNYKCTNSVPSSKHLVALSFMKNENDEDYTHFYLYFL